MGLEVQVQLCRQGWRRARSVHRHGRSPVAEGAPGNLARIPAHTESSSAQRGPRHQPSGNPSVAGRCTPPCPASTPGSAAPAHKGPQRGPPPYRAASPAGSFAGSDHGTDAKDSELSPPARQEQNEQELAIGRRAWLFAGSERGGHPPAPRTPAASPRCRRPPACAWPAHSARRQASRPPTEAPPSESWRPRAASPAARRTGPPRSRPSAARRPSRPKAGATARTPSAAW